MTPDTPDTPEMNDQQLDQLIGRARTSYRVPPDPSLDILWEGIARKRTIPPSPTLRRRVMPWRLLSGGVGVAAALVLAFTLGRYSVNAARDAGASGQPGQASIARAPSGSAAATAGRTPVASATTDLLGRTAILLAALPSDANDPTADRRFAQQAGDLLLTTRLLLDSRAADGDPALHTLLEDLELVLAQVARLRAGETRTERDLITDALERQDLVPRIRTIAAGLGAGAD